MNKPLVSIIVVNWNGAHLLEECLTSLLKTVYHNFEIIVIDNNSTDESEQVVKKFDSVVFYKHHSNSGYTGGNNIGFRISKGKYLVTLNNDVIVDPHWLDSPVCLLEKHPSAGIISCRQMQYYDPEKIDGLFSYLKKDLTFYPYGNNNRFDSKENYSGTGYVLIANGGSAILKKEMVEQIGGFDERFFAYYDETDLCMRANLHGWKIIYDPNSVVFHKGSQSFKQVSLKQYYFRERNRFWFFYKYFPAFLILKSLPSALVMELRIIYVFFLKCKKPLMYFKARFEAIASLKFYKETRMVNLELFKKHKNDILTLLKKKLIPF